MYHIQDTQEPTLCLVDVAVSNTGFIVQLWLSGVTFWLEQGKTFTEEDRESHSFSHSANAAICSP